MLHKQTDDADVRPSPHSAPLFPKARRGVGARLIQPSTKPAAINHPFTILGYTFLLSKLRAISHNRRLQMPRKASRPRQSPGSAESTKSIDTNSANTRDARNNPASRP